MDGWRYGEVGMERDDKEGGGEERKGGWEGKMAREGRESEGIEREGHLPTRASPGR